ncbi:MAG: nucleotidyltransferase [Bacteroidetes bacterium GWA2_31_9]|nr:MAG: nucleotidyltransferase [Bacteroidetes bacterium GWA2_31_9]
MAKAEIIDIVTKYTKLAKLNNNLQKVFLFGSYAKGTNREESDIDIALVFTDLKDPIDMQIQLMKLSRKIDSRIEPHPYRQIDFNFSNPVVSEILTYGIEINI